MDEDEPRELWLLRHAKSAWGTQAPTDFDRPLAKRGRKDAPRMGAWLAAYGRAPDHAVISPARRAEETWLLFWERLRSPSIEVIRDRRIYGGGLAELRAVLAEVPTGARRVLLLGHNPGLEELLLFLVPDHPPSTASGKLLTTGALAGIGLGGPWQDLRAGGGRLLALARPKEI